MISLATIKTWMIDTAIGFPVLVAFGIACEWASLHAVPTSHWFTISEFAPLSAQVGRPIDLYVRMAQPRSGDVRSQVTLYCDFGGGVQRFYSDQNIQIDNYPVRETPEIVEWSYTGQVPSIPAKCHLRLVRGVELRYGIWKRQTIETQSFVLKEQTP